MEDNRRPITFSFNRPRAISRLLPIHAWFYIGNTGREVRSRAAKSCNCNNA